MRTRLGGIALAATLAFAGALSACDGDGPERNRARGEPLRVYLSMPFAGHRDEQASEVGRGVRLAFEQAGGRAGTTRVELVVLPSTAPAARGWDPERVLRNARAAADDPATIGYIGELEAGASAISLPVLNLRGIPMVSPADTLTGLTRAASRGEPVKYYPSGERTFARMVPNDHLQAGALVDLLGEEGIGRIAVVRDATVYGRGLGERVARVAQRAGIEVVERREVDPGRDEPAAVAADLLASRPEALLVVTQADAWAGTLVRFAHSRDPGLRTLGPGILAEPRFARAAGAGLESVRLTDPIVAARLRPSRARRFAARFAARFGSRPAAIAFYGYEAARLLLAAIARAGDKPGDRAAVMRAILGAEHAGAVLDPYRIDRSGDTSRRVYAVLAGGADGSLARTRLAEPTGR